MYLPQHLAGQLLRGVIRGPKAGAVRRKAIRWDDCGCLRPADESARCLSAIDAAPTVVPVAHANAERASARLSGRVQTTQPAAG